MSVLQLINQLTHNEDRQQDLWMAYLEGASLESLPTISAKIDTSEEIYDKFKLQIQDLILDPVEQDFIDYLTETEQIIVCLLMLGCDLGTISRYNGINEVKIHQIVVSLRESNAWDKSWRLKETLMKMNGLV